MSKTALIFGASGLVGSALLPLLLDSKVYSVVKVFVRKPLPIQHHKMKEIIIDFDIPASYQSHLQGDDVYMCLGTTMAKSGSKKAFYKVDYNYVLEVATGAALNNVRKLCLISALGADAASGIYYSKVKGEVERDISGLAFETIHIVRPSLLIGDRKEKRFGERIGIILSKAFNFIFVGPLKKYKGVTDKSVAKAMFAFMQEPKAGVYFHESIELQKFN